MSTHSFFHHVSNIAQSMVGIGKVLRNSILVVCALSAYGALTSCASLGLNTNEGIPEQRMAGQQVPQDGNAKLEQMIAAKETEKQQSSGNTKTATDKKQLQTGTTDTPAPKKILSLRDQMTALDERQSLVQEDVRQIKSTLEDIQQRLQRMETNGTPSNTKPNKVVAGLSPLVPGDIPDQTPSPSTSTTAQQQKQRKPTPLFADGTLPKATSTKLPDNTVSKQSLTSERTEKQSLPKILTDKQADKSSAKKMGLTPLKADDKQDVKPVPQNDVKPEVKSYPEEYRKALQAIAKNDLPQAMVLLDKVIASEKNPKIIADAQCWAGETLYKQRQFREAIPRFKETIKSKVSDKVDDALLLLAECHRQLGETEEAKRYYNQLLVQHPKSEHIVEARKRLQML